VRVVGVDLSLTSTGLADSLGDVERVTTKAVPKDDVAAVSNRIRWIADEVDVFAGSWAKDDTADLVAIEGPSFASTGGQQHTRGGLWWVTVDGLLRRSVPILVVPPTVRAKYATGKGNASKDQVLASAIKRYPAIDITGNDIADAVLLAAIGARMLGDPMEEREPSAACLGALKTLSLPDGAPCTR